MSVIKGTAIEPAVRKPYKNYPLEELIKMNGLDEIAGDGPPVDMDMLKSLTEMKPAVHIKDGKYNAEGSDPSILYGGRYDDKCADGLRVVSYSPMRGGVYVEGAGSTYTLENAAISLSGNGFGLGGKTSGVAVGDHATLIVKNSCVGTWGANRSCSSAGQNSILKVYNSTLMSHGAPYGSDAPDGGYTEDGPPPALEIEGNHRVHCTVDNSYSYFYDSTIMADGWAALSTDMAMGFVYLEAKDCKVIATKSGYGAYADFGCNTKFIGCDFNVACQGIIMGGQSTAVFEDCALDCGSYFGHLHCVMGLNVEVGELTARNSKIKTKAAVVSIRSQNAIVSLENSEIESESGILVHAMFNDDLFTTKVRGEKVYGVHVNIKDMSAAGDIIHEDPERDMTVTLTSAVLEGAIVNSALIMDVGSFWFASGDSSVILGCDIREGQIDAPAGITIKAVGAENAEYILASGGKLIVTGK